MNTPINILVYRNNNIWESLASDLIIYVNTGAATTVKVFDAGTPESEIESWVQENAEFIKQAEAVFSDRTCGRTIVTSGLKERSKIFGRWNLELLFMQPSAQKVFRGVSPSKIYRQIFTRLVDTLDTKRVQIVLDALVDYNPLALPEFADDITVRNDIDALTRYAEEFKRLMPDGVEVEFIRSNELKLPDEQTLVVVHHHTLNRLRNQTEFHNSPRVLMPYPDGLIKKSSGVIDITDLLQEDFVEAMRLEIQMRTERSRKALEAQSSK
jgi:hypothetical protein